MNTYRIWYTYTVPDCDHPFVLIDDESNYVDIDATSEKTARRYFLSESYISKTRENLGISKVVEVKTNVNSLKRSNQNGEKVIQGVATAFQYKGNEICVIASNEFNLQLIGEAIIGDDFILNKDQLSKVNISEIKPKE